MILIGRAAAVLVERLRLQLANDDEEWKAEPAGAVISLPSDSPAPGVTHITAETLPPDSVGNGAGKERPRPGEAEGRAQAWEEERRADEDG